MSNCALGRRKRSWPGTWTWCDPDTLVYQIFIRNGPRRLFWRERTINYALQPEPRLLGELLRKGILEGV